MWELDPDKYDLYEVTYDEIYDNLTPATKNDLNNQITSVTSKADKIKQYALLYNTLGRESRNIARTNMKLLVSDENGYNY
jgi:hypothetical protein